METTAAISDFRIEVRTCKRDGCANTWQVVVPTANIRDKRRETCSEACSIARRKQTHIDRSREYRERSRKVAANE